MAWGCDSYEDCIKKSNPNEYGGSIFVWKAIAFKLEEIHQDNKLIKQNQVESIKAVSNWLDEISRKLDKPESTYYRPKFETTTSLARNWSEN